MSTKRACDSCHRRKIRCAGQAPCDNCRHSDLECTFNAVPKKKGPSGRRAKIIYAIRASQLQAKSFTPLLPQTSPPQAPPTNASRDLNLNTDDPAAFVPSPALKSCVDVFFWRMYPIMPILHKETVYNSLSTIHSSPEAYSLITALCGVVIMQPRMDSESYPSAPHEDKFEWPSVEYLIEETTRGRTQWDYIENPTLWTVITSFFLFACFFGLDKHSAAWFYLRESITFAELIGLPYEESYQLLDEREATLRRRMFWLLFVTERAYALQRHRPLSLQKSIELPEVPEGEESLVLQGFLDLVDLFQHFDASFVSLWNRSTATLSDTSWIPRLQENLALSIPDVGKRTEIQQADLLISRQWLKTMVWQLCLNKGLLSISGREESMNFHFPVQIARDMVVICRQLPISAMEPHGVGILEKVFDIGCSLADVMKVLPLQQSRFELGPRDYLMEMLRMLSTIRGGQSRYLPLLTAQADGVLGIGCSNPTVEPFFIPRSDPGVILGEVDSDESGYDSQNDSLSSTTTVFTSPAAGFHGTPYSSADNGSPLPAGLESWQGTLSPEIISGWLNLDVETSPPPPYEFDTGGFRVLDRGVHGHTALTH
ncbi:hypothetical protein FGG08_001472 [Glutinoglossum americanum]|uniref:Zn(2)-C6 fungal-type domain-containing protein n=1 Tax=Glutinoglossum americanum TaxID=1670608 RepID=A0A9P8IBB9_9PEZI|nr:hypothetical protein FGG08_001472 [Glutinoglossum americanum]